MADSTNTNVPDGWEVVSSPTTTGVPDGWEVVDPKGDATNTKGDGFPTSTAAATALRLAPAAVKRAAGVVAESPTAQKAVRTVIGAATGPVALATHGVVDFTPSAATIRRVAGSLAGEAPEATNAAVKAQSVLNYAKAAGTKLSPSHVIATTENPALDNFAKSQGTKILRLYNPAGEQVVGPETASALATVAPKAGVVAKVVGALPWVQAATSIGDLADVAEPGRKDNHIFGFEHRTDAEKAAHPALLNAMYQAAINKLLDVLGSK